MRRPGKEIIASAILCKHKLEGSGGESGLYGLVKQEHVCTKENFWIQSFRLGFRIHNVPDS